MCIPKKDKEKYKLRWSSKFIPCPFLGLIYIYLMTMGSIPQFTYNMLLHSFVIFWIFLNENGAVAYRFATAFGLSPRMRLDLLINDFVYQAVNDKTLVMFEKTFKRTFVHVDDMARGIVYAIENYDSMKNNTFNVGGDFNNYNKEEIALMIKKKVDYYLHFAEFGEDEDKRNYEVSYKKINDAGFFIEKTVEEGINELIQACPVLDSRNQYKNV